MKASLIKLAIVLASIFSPAQSVLLAALSLIMVDLITGVWASVKRGEKITSAGFQRTLVKLMVYEVAIALGFIAQHYLMGDAIPVMNMVGSYVGLTEMTSIYENLNTISGTELLKTVLEALRSKNSG